MPVLTINDVSYAYRSTHQTVYAVKNISCAFDSGMLYAIAGKSGSGKTTLLSLLAGLDLPESGEILFHNTPTSELNRDDLRRDHIAVIYQGYNLFALLTALENVAYPLFIKGSKHAKAYRVAREMLSSVGLDESCWRRFPQMLSGGEQQRVAIARALASGARIVLADEPTGNLDTENSAVVIDLLARLAHKDGCCVVLVTHDMDIASKADSILHMKDSRIVSIR